MPCAQKLPSKATGDSGATHTLTLEKDDELGLEKDQQINGGTPIGRIHLWCEVTHEVPVKGAYKSNDRCGPVEHNPGRYAGNRCKDPLCWLRVSSGFISCLDNARSQHNSNEDVDTTMNNLSTIDEHVGGV